MVLFGPQLIAFSKIEEGEKTLTNALKVAMHTKNLKLQLRVLYEVYESCVRKRQIKSQAVVADKYVKKMESLGRRIARATENTKVHLYVLQWQK